MFRAFGEDGNALHLEMRANTGEDALERNVRLSMARGLPQFEMADNPVGKSACVVGGGPSLRYSLPGLAQMARDGHDIFATNGTLRLLTEAGIPVAGFWMVDARPDNAEFLKGAPVGPVYYLASQCDPAVFDAATGLDVILWHDVNCGPILPDETVLIGGGSTVGLEAIAGVYALGYREINLFGFDSSYAGTDHHAYPQAMNDDENARWVRVGDREFRAANWMVRQMEQFTELSLMLRDKGVAVNVYGDGLLPAVAASMSAEFKPAPLLLDYDLTRMPVTWNFLEWMFNAKLHAAQTGASGLRVRFTGDRFRAEPANLSPNEQRRMLDGICRPVLALFGVEEEDSPDTLAAPIHLPYTVRPLADAFRAGQPLPIIAASPEATQWAEKYRGAVVITLREARYWPTRNSNLPAWLEFARGLDERVVFVRDSALASEELPDFETCSSAATNIDRRLALYRAAKMNLFVANGPTGLAHFTSDIPYLTFMKSPSDYPCHTDAWLREHVGIGRGEQFPWSTERQCLVWAEDTDASVIRAAFEAVPNS